MAGGEDQNWAGTRSGAEVYNPRTGTFVSTGSMSTARESHTAILLSNGLVLVAGGDEYPYGGQVWSSAELYKP